MYRFFPLLLLFPTVVFGQQPGEFVATVGPQPGCFKVTVSPSSKTLLKATKPIVFGNVWVETHSGTTSDHHLIEVHGFTPEQLRGLTQHQKNMLHGADHEGLTRVTVNRLTLGPAVQLGSSCPNGVCPLSRKRR